MWEMEKPSLLQNLQQAGLLKSALVVHAACDDASNFTRDAVLNVAIRVGLQTSRATTASMRTSAAVPLVARQIS
jgi:hypothetical protein